MNKLYAAGGLVIILGLAAYGLVQYGRALERADNNEIVAQLQSSLMELGRVIQKQESKAADNARKLVESDQERVDAITTNDHQTEEIERLESIIGQEREKSKAKDADKTGDNIHYRVIVTDSTVRVWDEARSSSELPASDAPSVLQKRLSAIAGDDINEAIRYVIGKYNACGIKYNKLWPTCDRIIEKLNKKPPQ